MEEKDIKPVTAVPVLPCGHEVSFEHELVDQLLGLVENCVALGISPIEPCMELVRKLFAHCFIPLPSYDELLKIKLAHSQYNNSKEVN